MHLKDTWTIVNSRRRGTDLWTSAKESWSYVQLKGDWVKSYCFIRYFIRYIMKALLDGRRDTARRTFSKCCKHRETSGYIDWHTEQMDRRTDGQLSIQIDCDTDGRVNRQTDRYTSRDGEANRHKENARQIGRRTGIHVKRLLNYYQTTRPPARLYVYSPVGLSVRVDTHSFDPPAVCLSARQLAPARSSVHWPKGLHPRNREFYQGILSMGYCPTSVHK